MKLSGTAAARFSARPDLARVGALLYGPEAGLIDHHRRLLVGAVTQGDDLRLVRIEAASLRRDPSLVGDELRARGFFPGRRAVLVEGAKDGTATVLAEALEGIGPEDGFLIVTAEGITTKSPLVKLFEGRGDLVSIGLYPDPPTAEDLMQGLAEAGVRCGLDAGAEAALVGAAAELDLGEIRQLIDKIAVFCLGRAESLSEAELAPLLPQAQGGEVDALASRVALGAVREIGPLMARLETAGVTPATMIITLGRYFRMLQSLVEAPDGAEAALGRMRPPVRGPRARLLIGQAQRWRGATIEGAVRAIFAADRALRSPGARPDRAMVERCLIRVAMMAGRP